MTSLELKQIFFLQTIAQFIFDAKILGYSLTSGEFWRSGETCALYEKEGKGVLNSNHSKRLAADLNVFFDDKLVSYTFDAYLPLGVVWENYSTSLYQCCWGGRFKTHPDVDHFSVLHDNVR